MNSLAQLLFPLSCLLCREPGADLCLACDRKIRRNTHASYVDEVELWAAAYYGEELAQLILLAKEKNSAPARNFLAHLIVERLMESQKSVESLGSLTLIPLPSRPAANRERGFRHGYLLAQGVAAAIAKRGGGTVEVREYLRVNRRVADQSNLNRAERMRNLAGAYSVKTDRNLRSAGKSPRKFFLVDDLVTSGASAGEGLRALRVAGITPSAVLSAGVSLGVSTGVIS